MGSGKGLKGGKKGKGKGKASKGKPHKGKGNFYAEEAYYNFFVDIAFYEDLPDINVLSMENDHESLSLGTA